MPYWRGTTGDRPARRIAVMLDPAPAKEPHTTRETATKMGDGPRPRQILLLTRELDRGRRSRETA
jgi:hypothetical protein